MFGCAQLQDLGCSPDGLRVAEVAAFTISSDYRGGGRGDSLLDYVEQQARADVRLPSPCHNPPNHDRGGQGSVVGV